jgi:hypothetical protein
MAGNFEDVAKQFIEFYYNTFDTDRKTLNGLYREQSMLTFESASVLGVSSIVEKLTSLPFEKVKHQVATLDAQPTMVDGGIVILVTGQLLVCFVLKSVCKQFQILISMPRSTRSSAR